MPHNQETALESSKEKVPSGSPRAAAYSIRLTEGREVYSILLDHDSAWELLCAEQKRCSSACMKLIPFFPSICSTLILFPPLLLLIHIQE
jgi:hypothetical protein